MLMGIGRSGDTFCCHRDTKDSAAFAVISSDVSSSSDVSLDIEPHLTDKRCSCDGRQFTPSRLKRGDLGQLAPRKKLLKSFRAFLEDFLRSLQAFGTEGFFVFGPLPADPKSIQ